MTSKHQLNGKDEIATKAEREQTVQVMEPLTETQSPKSTKTSPSSLDQDSYSYDQYKAILYALAVGTSVKEKQSLNFLYESSDNFMVLPTFGTIIGMDAVMSSHVLRKQMKELKADPRKILHGGQFIELYKPFPPSAVLTTKCQILDVLDKGSGAIVIVEGNTINKENERLMRLETSLICPGAGNFGGKRTTDKAMKVLSVPNRKPDAVIEEKTSADQAALYRLCGDKNPIHIDPSIAAKYSFDRPILHGLCTYGYATRHVLKQFANYNVNLFKAINVKFANPIIPGDTLRTEMWKEGNRIHFETSCVETGKKVISDAYVDLLEFPKTADGPVTSELASDLRSKLILRT